MGHAGIVEVKDMSSSTTKLFCVVGVNDPQEFNDAQDLEISVQGKKVFEDGI
jgi:hypothetical protein